MDPTLLRVSDLSRSVGDSLVMRVRKKLRRDYGYPSGDNSSKNPRTWRISAVHTLPTGSSRAAPPPDSCTDDDDVEVEVNVGIDVG